MNRWMKFLIRFALAFLGGMLGNFLASAYLIRGETEDDTKGLVAADPTTVWGKDDMVRVASVITGSMAVLRIAKRFKILSDK